MSPMPPTGGGAPRLGQETKKWRFARRRRSSLYTRVVLVNAVVMVSALMVLLLTPVTVSSRPSAHQVELLVTMLAVMVVANAVLLRVSFTGLAALAGPIAWP